MSVIAIPDAVEFEQTARLRLASAVAVAAVGVFQLLDIVTTHIMLAHGAIESNPLAKFLLAGGRVEVIKVALVIALAWRVLRRPPTVAFSAGVWFVAGFYFLTVVSNLLIIARLS
jgi:hypothetical protein